MKRLRKIALWTLLAILLLANVLVDNPFQGWTPRMIVDIVMGGAQMLTLGVIGEYLWRILVRVQRRNPYWIETILPPASCSRPLPDEPLPTGIGTGRNTSCRC